MFSVLVLCAATMLNAVTVRNGPCEGKMQEGLYIYDLPGDIAKLSEDDLCDTQIIVGVRLN